MATSFGERLHYLRGLAAVSADRLAEKAGLSTVTVYALERNAAAPSLETAQKLAGALGVSLKEFDRCRPPGRQRAAVRA